MLEQTTYMKLISVLSSAQKQGYIEIYAERSLNRFAFIKHPERSSEYRDPTDKAFNY